MKIPKKIKIGGQWMDILQDKCLGAGDRAYGECDFMRGRIVIDSNQPEDHKEVTLLHEIIEKIKNENELEIEHRNITSLAYNLHQVLKDNKLSFN